MWREVCEEVSGECGRCKEVLGEVKGSVRGGMEKCGERYSKVCWGVCDLKKSWERCGKA